MNDFLSTLLDRALGRAPVLERRRPSLFEPLPGADGPRQEGIWPSTEAPQESESAESPEAPRPRRRPARDRLEEVDSWREGPPATASPFLPADGARQEVNQPNLNPVAGPPVERIVRLVEREVPLLPMQSAPSIQEHASAPPAAASPAMARPVDLPGREAARQESGPGQRPSPPAPAHAPSARPAVVTPVVPPVIRPAAAETAPARPAVITPVIAPAIRPVTAPRSLPSIVRGERSSAPTIQVTIGRIEVRAPSAPAAPGRAAPPAGPKLNLEDYLRARGGGRR